MQTRYVFKIAGAAGQGIKSSGMLLLKALKRAGYASFGYTEYPSLIRGGHNVFQIEISDHQLNSITRTFNLLVALNEESVKLHRDELEENGVIIYDDGAFTLNEETKILLSDKKIDIYAVPLLSLAKDSGGSAIMKNTVALGCVWKIFSLDLKILNDIVAATFAHKSKEIIDTNIRCVQAGYDFIKQGQDFFAKNFTPSNEFADDMIITGNEAVALGAIAAGVRLYSSYPMTPSSAILTYLAENGPKYGMIIKQAEDEITAANMVIGCVLAGARAMCATSGGGFDLMTEAISLAGITEAPFVVVLGQRPGPATGVPTWTAQGDLMLAVNGGHGEFPRIVLAPSNPTEAFNLTRQAHNLAEKFQLPVIILTDKYLAESTFSTHPFDLSEVKVERGKLLSAEELKQLPEQLRYQYTEDGISPRWLPGDDATPYVANSDEHDERGYSTEDSIEIKKMMAKRMRKLQAVIEALPHPQISGEENEPDVCILSWGSTKNVVLDAIKEFPSLKITSVHYNHIWPLKTEKAVEMIEKARYTFSVENNYNSQFTSLFRQQCGYEIKDKLTRFDSKPFYLEDLLEHLQTVKDKLIK